MIQINWSIYIIFFVFIVGCKGNEGGSDQAKSEPTTASISPSPEATGQDITTSPVLACPEGQTITEDTAGQCCWPAQVWNGTACVGKPRCPDGYSPTKAQTCAPTLCEGGRVLAANAPQCCWPGQGYSRDRSVCIGTPQCPSDYKTSGEDCEPLPCADEIQVHVVYPFGIVCCWPGQTAPEGTCVGEPACPKGFKIHNGGCTKAIPDGMVEVPAGEFLMGCNSSIDNQCYPDEKPQHKVYLDAFYIDKTEVTVGDYKKCVDAGVCKPPACYSSRSWGKEGRENRPVDCVNWFKAKAYCEWAGKRLPTEAEWEKAARGTDGRKFPWGNEPASCTYAVMRTSRAEGCGTANAWDVGSKPQGASPYGALDMVGNVAEWTADWYGAHYYKSSTDRNPTGPSGSRWRVVRGASFFHRAGERASSRLSSTPSIGDYDIGFRCARSAP